MNDSDTNLDHIEGQVAFFERNLNNKQRNGMTTTTIMASVLILLIRALLANVRELKRLNNKDGR